MKRQAAIFDAVCLTPVGALALTLAASLPAPAQAAPKSGAKQASAKQARPALSVRLAQVAPALPAPHRWTTAMVDALPQYVPMKTVESLRLWREQQPYPVQPVLQPLIDGHALKTPMRDLLTAPSLINPGVNPVVKAPPRTGDKITKAEPRTDDQIAKALPPEWQRITPELGRFAQAMPPVAALPPAPPTGGASGGATAGAPSTLTPDQMLLAQVIPAPVPPAPVIRPAAPAPKPEVPRWVRYPLEFQLCGIGLGTRAVDKDQYNRIDRYGLFAMHGNPTAVVVPSADGGTITVTQQPPEINELFPASQEGGLPDWAGAITVSLDRNHVEWLYRRDTYSMGFIVDRLGFVDAVVCAGVQSNIARTQLEDPLHTVKLGDDLRKVLYRYGYPDTIETYAVSAIAGAGVPAPAAAGGGGAEGGAEGGAGGAPGGAAGAGGGSGRDSSGGSGGGAAGGEGGAGAAAGAGLVGNAGFRTFEFRYEQSYNVVFTIRNNRVVRIYIFGDPDFFNDKRRDLLRTSY